MLKNLDVLEDHPNYYQRRPEKVFLSCDGETEGLCSNAKSVKYTITSGHFTKSN